MAGDRNPAEAPTYRSRILREMAANRANPHNSPPSSTGSHGTASPTQSSVFTDPEGESTRQLNEAISRITSRSKMQSINWAAAHRKWPEFFSMPDDAESRPPSQKENKPPTMPTTVRFANQSTRNDDEGSESTRATMQPQVDDKSELVSILSASPDQHSPRRQRTGSPKKSVAASVKSLLMNPQNQVANKAAAICPPTSSRTSERSGQRERHRLSSSPPSSARSSLTAVQNPSDSPAGHNHDVSHAPSFFMPDVSHLGDFITGTLKLTGSYKNGVPILVKHGKVFDQKERPLGTHAAVDGVDIPDDEGKIFVSMDMICDEVISLQDHFSKMQAYAEDLQRQVRKLEARNSKGSPPSFGNQLSDQAQSHWKLRAEKMQLEGEIAGLRARLDRTDSGSPADHSSISLERDRAVRRLQSACDDISKLTKKLSLREKELESSHRQLESTDQLRHDHEALRTELNRIQSANETLTRENASLKADHEAMRQAHDKLQQEVESLRSERKATSRTDDSLSAEIRSLHVTLKNLKAERDDLAQVGRHDHHDLCAAEDIAAQLRQQIEHPKEEKAAFKEEFDRLIRHNDDYVNENQILRRENDHLERNIRDLHAEKVKWRVEFDQLRGRLDNCRILPDVLGPVEEETEENMTSAVFVPDATLDTDISGLHDVADPRQAGAHDTANASRHVNITDNRQPRNTRVQEVLGNHHHNNNNTTQGQKVAFSVPGKTDRGDRAVANQRTKRISQTLADKHGDNRTMTKLSKDRDEDANDTTGLQSVDNTTQAPSLSSPAPTTATTSRPTKHGREPDRDQSSHEQNPQEAFCVPRKCPETHIEAVERAVREACPALSSDARRILDRLSGHDCSNCTVCNRIASHGGVLPPADAPAAGKKCIKVLRPVPVSDRALAGDDPTTRPSRSSGHALAIVIKSLEDERRHLEMEMSQLQDRFGSCDKALAKRERYQLAKQIRATLKLSLAKDDQIYSLYDVLEGQKAAGQAMSEEELEMTILSITGMTLRDVTTCADNYTWRSRDA